MRMGSMAVIKREFGLRRLSRLFELLTLIFLKYL